MAPLRMLGQPFIRFRQIWRLLPSVLREGGGVKATVAKAYSVYGTEGLEGVKSRLIGIQVTAAPIPQTPLPVATHAPAVTSETPPAVVASANQLIVARFAHAVPMSVFQVPRSGEKRISLITDSINQGSLFGGVGTALILATLLAARRGARLRVVTRTERANPNNLHAVLALYGVTLDKEVEFAFASIRSPQPAIDVFEDELFVTTSWWTTEATLASIAPPRIMYVLQEDERMFYPGGDDHLRCSQLLTRDGLAVAVNTQGLLDHLISSGLPQLATTALAFEPAFPSNVYYRRPKPGGRRRLMFYARPNHVRNLFYFGLDVLDNAVARGIVDTEKWEILLVGANIPVVQFCDGTTPRRVEGLSWAQYAELAGTIDVGLCLMYTPHPSYPPLDLAASGAVVVTNRFANKHSLTNYCANILSADLDLESMLATLQQGMQLAENEPERGQRFEAHRLQPDWQTALAPVVEKWSRGSHVWN